MNHRILIIPVLLLFSQLLPGQNISRIDSLKSLLQKEKTDTGKIIIYCRLSHELEFSDLDLALEYSQMALDESVRLRFEKGKGNALIQFGNIEQVKGNYDKAEKYYLEALDIVRKTKDLSGTAVCYNNLGIMAHNRNDYTLAMEYYNKSLALNQKIGRKQGIATSLFCIGTVHENKAQYDSALTYYFRAQSISESIGDPNLIAYAKISLSNIYLRMGNYLRSLELNHEAIGYYEKTRNNLGLMKVYLTTGQIYSYLDSTSQAIWYYRQVIKTGLLTGSTDNVGNALFSIGEIFENLGTTDSAMVYYTKANSAYISTGNRENNALSLIAMARINNLKGNFEGAKKLLSEALETGNEIKSPPAILDATRELSFTWYYLDNFQKAFLYMNRYSDIRDSLMTAEKQKQILELQTQYETVRKEKENELLKKDQQILQRTRNSLVIGALMLILLVVVIYRSLAIKKKDNELLRIQKEEIAYQKDIVEIQKTSITDSIRYAKRIQSAMLPPEETRLPGNLESFILYLPRDIVSGDFYWARQIDEKNLLVCAADCTGHGVPGAFMSMLGMSVLNDIAGTNAERIREKTLLPGEILNEMRTRIKSSLRQTGKEGETRDGMDLSLCLVETNTRKLFYSGAINPVYYVSNGNLTEIKATRNPIGIYVNEVDFLTTETVLPPETVIYMFSDGFSDQIGKEGKKYLSRNFKNLLSEISYLPLDEVRERLHKVHLDWKKDEEQVDDVMVIGIRLS